MYNRHGNNIENQNYCQTNYFKLWETMGMKLSNKIALIVGATSGIGKAAAIKMASEGATVIVTGRREEQGNAVVNEITANGGKAHFIKFDVLDLASFETLKDQIANQFGRLDVYVYNSGISGASNSSLHNITEEVFDSVMDTNLKGCVFLTKALMPLITESKGTIVFTSSLVSVSAQNSVGSVVYAPSKAALSHLVRTIALAIGKDGIRINAVAPGVTRTEILDDVPQAILDQLVKRIPLGYMGEPEDMANAICFLACDDSRFITGQTIFVDGGSSIG